MMSHAATDSSSPDVQSSALALALGWPGLIFWLGEGVLRVLGYFAFVLAGICAARKDGFGVFLFELLMGHVLICGAEVVDKMNEERKRDSSANKAICHPAPHEFT